MNVAAAAAWAVDDDGERSAGGSVQARATATVTVQAEVTGSTQTQAAVSSGSTRTLRMPQTGAEIVGTLAGAIGLIGLGLLVLTGRRRRE